MLGCIKLTMVTVSVCKTILSANSIVKSIHKLLATVKMAKLITKRLLSKKTKYGTTIPLVKKNFS